MGVGKFRLDNLINYCNWFEIIVTLRNIGKRQCNLGMLNLRADETKLWVQMENNKVSLSSCCIREVHMVDALDELFTGDGGRI